MQKRKCFSRILALFLFIGLILASSMEAKALVIDFRLPSDIEIVVDKQEVTLGEKVQIRIETSAKSSELGDEAYVAYVNDGGLVKKVKEIKLSKDANSFVGNILVDRDFLIGLWKIDFIVITKSDNNSVVVYNDDTHKFRGDGINHKDMSNGNILVKEFANYELFEDIAVSLSNVKMLDTEKITISANGGNSGLEKEAYALYSLENEFGVYEKEIKLLLNDNNNYIGEFVIDESFRPGVWKLNYIILKDKSGHREIVYNKELHGTTVNNSFRYLSKGNFTVERDMYGPVIGKFNKIRLNDIEEKYLITVEASDESKLYEKAYIKYVSKYNDKIIEQDVLLELVDGKYQGVFQRQDYNAWNVDFILFKDIDGNASCVYNSELHQINSMDLSDLNILEDDKAPSVKGVEIKNLELDGQYEVKVTPSKDESQLGSKVYVVYEAVDGKVRLEEEVVLTLENGVYTGKFKPDEYSKPLLWQISHMILFDVKNNIGIYYNNNIHGSVPNGMDLSEGDFNTTGEDTVGPNFKGIAVSHKKIKINNEIRVEVNLAIAAEDNISKLGKEAYVLYRSNNAKSREVELTLNEDGIYIGRMLLFEGNAGEDWFIDYVILADEMNNRTIIYNHDIHGIGESFEKQNIKVEGVKLVLNNINVDIEDINSLREARITAEVEGINGKGRGYILFVDQNGVEKEVTLSGDNGVLKGTFKEIPDGEWNMSYIIVGDMVGNRKIVYNSELHSNIFPSADLSVYDIEIKADVPKLCEIFVESNSLVLYDNESTKIKIKASDSSGLSDVAYVKYVGEGLEQEFKLTLIDGYYEGEITLNSEMPQGIIKVDYIILKDKDNNSSIIYNSQIHNFGQNLSAANISIENMELVPKLGQISVESNTLVLYDNESTKIKIKALDSSRLSDVAYVKYVGEGLEQEFKLTLIDGYYEGEITVNSDMSEGIIKVDYIILKNKDNNSSIIYNSQIHNFGENLSAADISIENPELGMSILGVNVEKSVIDYGEEIGIEVKVSKGVFNLNDKAYLRYVQVENNILTEKEIILKKVDEATYRGSFKADNIKNLGNWMVDYVLFSDEQGNIKINYNSELNTIGTDISSGDIRVGDLVVHDVLNSIIHKGIDFVSKFVISNYSDTDRKITLVVEVKDVEGRLLSKFKVNKQINSIDYDIIDSRVKINEEAEFVDVYVLDDNGAKLYDILDNCIIK